jgi:hypothetical protein
MGFDKVLRCSVTLTSPTKSLHRSVQDSSVFFNDSSSSNFSCIEANNRWLLIGWDRFWKYTAYLRQNFSQALTVLDRSINSCFVSILTCMTQLRDLRTLSSCATASLEAGRCQERDNEYSWVCSTSQSREEKASQNPECIMNIIDAVLFFIITTSV